MLRRNVFVRQAMKKDQQWLLTRTRQDARTRPGRRILSLSLLLLLLLFVGVAAALFVRANQASSVPTSTPITASQNAPVFGSVTPSTPQVRTGVFSLSSAGPIPVPANVLKPVNGARTVLNNEIYSLYAGSMTRQPQIGALVVLRENILNGQETLHIYQSPRHQGALTIVGVQQHIVSFTTAAGTRGRFDLLSDQFQFS